jgi:hypothetical protein
MPSAKPDPVCLDHNATTPIAPEVLDAMLPGLRDHHGNPSDSHVFGPCLSGCLPMGDSLPDGVGQRRVSQSASSVVGSVAAAIPSRLWKAVNGKNRRLKRNVN